MQNEPVNKPQNTIFSAYVHVGRGKVETTNEVIKGRVYADLDEDGHVVGFEFISPLDVEVNGELK